MSFHSNQLVINILCCTDWNTDVGYIPGFEIRCITRFTRDTDVLPYKVMYRKLAFLLDRPTPILLTVGSGVRIFLSGVTGSLPVVPAASVSHSPSHA